MAEDDKNTDVAEATEEKRSRYLSTVEPVGPCKVEVSITVPVETLEEEIDSRYAEIIRTVPFPGFRVGHAPRRLVEKKLGEEVTAEVKEQVISESFKEAVEEHDLDPIADPDVDLEGIEIEPGKPLEYKATMVVRPTIELPDYESIEVERAKPEVSDEMVDAHLENERRRQAVLEPVADGEMEAGDVAVVDFVATVGDEKLAERENVEYHHPAPFLPALPTQIPGIEDEIKGKKAGDEITVTAKLPESWPEEEQAGKEMTVALTVQEVKRYVLPELDQEFAESLDYDSVDELVEEAREHVERGAEHDAEIETDRRIVDALLAAVEFELPEDVVKEETKRRLDRLKAQLRMQRAGEEEVEKKLAEARSAEGESVEREFRSMFLLNAVAKAEKVFVTEREVDERVAQMAGAYGRSYEDMREHLEQQGLLSSIRAEMREEKVMELLRKKVKINE